MSYRVKTKIETKGFDMAVYGVSAYLGRKLLKKFSVVVWQGDTLDGQIDKEFKDELMWSFYRLKIASEDDVRGMYGKL